VVLLLKFIGKACTASSHESPHDELVLRGIIKKSS
jgi:hypothetical protein